MIMRFAVSTTLILAMGALACGSGPVREEPGTRIDIPENRPELGPLEAQALAYLERMTELLATGSADPMDTVRSLGSYLDANRDAMIENARLIEARVEAMTPGERVYYEEQFAALFGPAVLRWSEALDAFRQAHPDAATRIDGLMIYFD